MPLDVLNTILPPSAAECEDSSLVHPFQPPASSRARLSGSFLIQSLHGTRSANHPADRFSIAESR
jgi:hypothetical protein